MLIKKEPKRHSLFSIFNFETEEKREITKQEIREKAYLLWESAGRLEGNNEHFWNVAENELKGNLNG